MKSLAPDFTFKLLWFQLFFTFTLLSGSYYAQATPPSDVTPPQGSITHYHSKLTFYTAPELSDEPVCNGVLDGLDGFFIPSSCLQTLQKILDDSDDIVMLSVENAQEPEEQSLTVSREDLEQFTVSSDELVFVNGLPEPDSNIWKQVERNHQVNVNVQLASRSTHKVYSSHSKHKRSDTLYLSDCNNNACYLSEHLPNGHPVYDHRGNLVCLAQESTSLCSLARKPRQANNLDEQCNGNSTVSPPNRFIPDNVNTLPIMTSILVADAGVSALAGGLFIGLCCICKHRSTQVSKRWGIA